jgi:hypothetical protein
VTAGADTHYTTTGVDPTQADASVASGGTVVVDQSLTLKASAWAAGMPVSNVASAVFTMNLPLPTIAPVAGTYLSTQSVTLSSSISGATIRYTTDGTDPTSSSPVYSSAITVDATTTVKAYAFKAGWTDSNIGTTAYTLKAVAKKGGKVVATDEVVTAGAPAKIELVADRSTIHADGDDPQYLSGAVRRERLGGNVRQAPSRPGVKQAASRPPPVPQKATAQARSSGSALQSTAGTMSSTTGDGGHDPDPSSTARKNRKIGFV